MCYKNVNCMCLEGEAEKEMQGVHQHYMPLTNGGGGGKGSSRKKKMELTASTMLTIDVEETTEGKIRRLISENPVIIFSRSSCCMCHVMKRLLSTIGVHPTVIELEEEEMSVLPAQDSNGGKKKSGGGGGGNSNSSSPGVFIGGVWIGGLESLMGLHLSGNLVPKLREVGAL